MSHATRRISLAMIPLLAVPCTTFHLAEQSGNLAIPKHRRAKDVLLLVSAFSFEPRDADDAGKLTEGDLDKWQRMLAAGIDQSNIVQSVAVARPGETPLTADYSISGRITSFRF